MAETGIDQIAAADLVVGLIPAFRDAAAIEPAINRILESVPPLQAVLVHPPYPTNGAETARPNSQWRLVMDPHLAQDGLAIADSLNESFRSILDTSRKLGARACAVITSDLSAVTAEWVALLLQPAVEEHFDLVSPCYAQHPFEGMINRAIIYPLVRALYGKRIRNPLGPDFGISAGLVDRMSASSKSRVHPLASLVVEAVTGGLKTCQVHLGPRALPRPDWANLSSLLSQVLGPLYLDVERFAPQWQHTRGSETIPEFGNPMFVPGPESAVEVTRLIESFVLGARNLPEIWSMILPPSTVVELRRLARQDAGGFRMPDETWARVVYDFALAHRLRTINRDQMLRAMTPIYLGWVASYALELESATPGKLEQRVERLCQAFENTKTYFVSRWRWPDRFNP